MQRGNDWQLNTQEDNHIRLHNVYAKQQPGQPLHLLRQTAEIHAKKHNQQRHGQRMAQTNVVIPAYLPGDDNHPDQKDLHHNAGHKHPGGNQIDVT